MKTGLAGSSVGEWLSVDVSRTPVVSVSLSHDGRHLALLLKDESSVRLLNLTQLDDELKAVLPADKHLVPE